MFKDIITSNFRKLPWAFFIAAMLFLATECFLYANRPELVRDYWNKFLINEHELIDMETDYDYLIMGNSIQKTGINPSLISDKILNLGLPGAKPIGQLLILKRYLKKHKPPKAIFLYVDPEDAHDSLYVILRYFVTLPEIVSIWKDLSWEEKKRFLLRYWVSLDERKTRLTERERYHGGNEAFVEEMIRNQGHMPSPTADKAIPDDYFTEHKKRHQVMVSITSKDMKYLEEFVKLASSKDIKIVFLGFLVPEQLYYIFKDTGFNTNYEIFYNVLKKLYPDAYFVDEPILYLENSYFSDMSHVNKEGSKVYTEYFKRLFESMDF